MSRPPQPPYPLHESIRDKLHPDYTAFYNTHIIHQQQVHHQPINVSRSSGILIPGAGPLVPVGQVQDIHVDRVETKADSGPDPESSSIPVRVFTPPGPVPVGGWPVFLYLHGGGWVLGNIDTENVVCRHVCVRAECVVVTVDYRLAPEHPFPAAVQDCWEVLLWLVSPKSNSNININTSKLVVGGSSAGGNLAAVLTHKALHHNNSNLTATSTSTSTRPEERQKENKPPIRTKAQFLVVPVIDNTATTTNNWSWHGFQHTPALPAAKMMWYRNHYLPNQTDWANPDASPLLAVAPEYTSSDHGHGHDHHHDGEKGHGGWAVAALPPAVVIVGELDVLRAEGELYADRLRAAGVPVDLHVMRGMPHPFLAMDGVLEAGGRAITLLCEGARRIFGSS